MFVVLCTQLSKRWQCTVRANMILSVVSVSTWTALFAIVGLLEFHVRIRLVGHLRDKSAVCAGFYMTHLPKLPPNIVSLLEANDAMYARENVRKGRSPAYSRGLPAFRLTGPLVRAAQALHPFRANRASATVHAN